MSVANPDAELRRRSPWRVLLPAAIFVLVVLAALGTRIGYGQPGPGELVLSGGYGLIAIWAVIDGVRRLFGRPTFLGTGRGLDRLFGLIQAALSIGIAIALLPNTVSLLDFLSGASRR